MPRPLTPSPQEDLGDSSRSSPSGSSPASAGLAASHSITIAQLRDLASKATPGPWAHNGDGEDEDSAKAIWTADERVLICRTQGPFEWKGRFDAPERFQDANARYNSAAQPSAILALLDHAETLRATLESRSVRLMGPRSPFWRCEYCQAMQTSPIAFPHKPDCLLAGAPTP